MVNHPLRNYSPCQQTTVICNNSKISEYVFYTQTINNETYKCKERVVPKGIIVVKPLGVAAYLSMI